MTVNEKIITALAGFGDPVAWGESIQPKGGSPTDRYYSFNYTTLPDDFGDDAPSHECYLVQVHFHCPRTLDSVERIGKTKKALFKAGFTYPSCVNASDADGQHHVFECEIAEGVDTDGEA